VCQKDICEIEFLAYFGTVLLGVRFLDKIFFFFFLAIPYRLSYYKVKGTLSISLNVALYKACFALPGRLCNYIYYENASSFTSFRPRVSLKIGWFNFYSLLDVWGTGRSTIGNISSDSITGKISC
jgi:hypothetical protein